MLTVVRDCARVEIVRTCFLNGQLRPLQRTDTRVPAGALTRSIRTRVPRLVIRPAIRTTGEGLSRRDPFRAPTLPGAGTTVTVCEVEGDEPGVVGHPEPDHVFPCIGERAKRRSAPAVVVVAVAVEIPDLLRERTVGVAGGGGEQHRLIGDRHGGRERERCDGGPRVERACGLNRDRLDNLATVLPLALDPQPNVDGAGRRIAPRHGHAALVDAAVAVQVPVVVLDADTGRRARRCRERDDPARGRRRGGPIEGDGDVIRRRRAGTRGDRERDRQECDHGCEPNAFRRKGQVFAIHGLRRRSLTLPAARAASREHGL